MDHLKSNPVEPFRPYATMFKVAVPTIEVGERKLKCVNCKAVMRWKLYRVCPAKFDTECPVCRVTTDDFWRGKPHRKVNSNA